MTLLDKALWPIAYEWRLRRLRRQLERAFSEETAAPGFPRSTPSAGQCAAVSTVLHYAFGAEFASARVDGLSHWFNRLKVGSSLVDVDLTGDQFGRAEIQQGPSGSLYEGTRPRDTHELSVETLERAVRLADRAGLTSIRDKIAVELNSRRTSEDRLQSLGVVSQTG